MSGPQEKKETITLRPEDKINISPDHRLLKTTGIDWQPKEGICDRAEGHLGLLGGVMRCCGKQGRRAEGSRPRNQELRSWDQRF
jgi:hypothetical protein